MAKTDLSKEELLKIIERQEKVVQGYEAISWFYQAIKKIPFLMRFLSFLAGILKSKRISGTTVVDNIKEENPSLIAVCHPNFRGVRSATYELTENVFEASELFSAREVERVAKKIIAHKPQKVLLSGYYLGTDLLSLELKKQDPNVKIYLYSHSSFLWLDVYRYETTVFEKLLKQAEAGIIEKIGFCKKDLTEYFKQQGYNSYYVMNRFEIEGKKQHVLNKEKIKIGVFGNNWWHRNILNQVIAALMLPNIEVHVNEIGDFAFIDKKRVVVHGFMPKKEFKALLEEMDINLYVSMTDCFPMTLIESMEFGIPALASDTSHVYSWSKKLQEALVVSQIDGPVSILKRIQEVLKNYEEIQEEIKSYLPILKKEVEKSIEEFLK